MPPVAPDLIVAATAQLLLWVGVLGTAGLALRAALQNRDRTSGPLGVAVATLLLISSIAWLGVGITGVLTIALPDWPRFGLFLAEAALALVGSATIVLSLSQVVSYWMDLLAGRTGSERGDCFDRASRLLLSLVITIYLGALVLLFFNPTLAFTIGIGLMSLVLLIAAVSCFVLAVLLLHRLGACHRLLGRAPVAPPSPNVDAAHRVLVYILVGVSLSVPTFLALGALSIVWGNLNLLLWARCALAIVAFSLLAAFLVRPTPPPKQRSARIRPDDAEGSPGSPSPTGGPDARPPLGAGAGPVVPTRPIPGRMVVRFLDPPQSTVGSGSGGPQRPSPSGPQEIVPVEGQATRTASALHASGGARAGPPFSTGSTTNATPVGALSPHDTIPPRGPAPSPA
jgi:hypothetical protein